MNIIADPNIPFVREAFSSLGEVQFVPGRQMDAAAVRSADILLVRSVTSVHEGLLGKSRVKFVATATIGTDHIDIPWLTWRGIGFASAAGSNANSVAEYVVAAMLTLAQRNQFRLRDKTLGIVGVGNVGSRVERYARALGMRVLLNDPPRQRAEPDKAAAFVSLDQVIGEADIITTHVPMTREGPDKTWHLVDPGHLQPRQMIINSARGGVIDNQRLLDVLTAKRLGGAVLDVWEGEPHLLRPLLAAVDLGTPHIAGYSFDGKVNGVQMIYKAACQHFHQQPTWQPEMPPPPVPSIEEPVAPSEDDESALLRIIRQVYNIEADDRALREKTAEFDWLRAHYPVRREFGNTRLVFRAGDAVGETLRQKASALGFDLP